MSTCLFIISFFDLDSFRFWRHHVKVIILSAMMCLIHYNELSGFCPYLFLLFDIFSSLRFSGALFCPLFSHDHLVMSLIFWSLLFTSLLLCFSSVFVLSSFSVRLFSRSYLLPCSCSCSRVFFLFVFRLIVGKGTL